MCMFDGELRLALDCTLTMHADGLKGESVRPLTDSSTASE